MNSDRIGVFLRCLGIEDLPRALAAARDDLGLRLIQVSKLADDYYSETGGQRLAEMLRREGVRADSVVIVHEGESYANLEAVRRTVGYLPPETLPERIEYSKRCLDLAAALGVAFATTHIGLLPEDAADSGYERLLAAVAEVGEYGRDRGVALALETGQETAQELAQFLDQLPGLPLGINFDPGNFAIYGSDDPLAALHLLRERIMGVHVKDGVPPDHPGELGSEARPGEGKAQLAQCLRCLAETGYRGAYVIENYVARTGSATDKLAEIERAKRFIEDTAEL